VAIAVQYGFRPTPDCKGWPKVWRVLKVSSRDKREDPIERRKRIFNGESK
jgi:hypothetical protein